MSYNYPMGKMLYPENYRSSLNLYETQMAIKLIKDSFQKALSERLNLRRVTAPLFVDPTSGLNDNLNGVERPVSFSIKDEPAVTGEVVQSLAKWKRYALGKYHFAVHEGLYTDMDAIRRDEDLDNIHSLYVDQWDWEKVIRKEDRNLAYLEETVRLIYEALKETALAVAEAYPSLKTDLPKNIAFIDSEALLRRYPNKSPKEREAWIAKETKAVFIERIGAALSDGKPHDLRAPDYDDWSLNGDILVWFPTLGIPLELSSMGIRVDAKALQNQLVLSHQEKRASLPFQKAVLEEKVPFTIGGGIGQSRLCMFYLQKAHIGEVQCSLWPKKMIGECHKHGIELL
jgi:aspartate--ammonia ligase